MTADASLPIFYSTRDGHTCKIAERIAARLCASGVAARAANAASFPLPPETLSGLPLFVLIAAVRYGIHMRDAQKALDAYKKLAKKPPLVLASVNLTARKANRRTAQDNPYLRKWIGRRKLTPALTAAIAGRLDYPSYSTFDRVCIRFIMTLTGGETDPTAQIEYTDWNAVDAFADEIGKLCRERSAQSR
jgi:menaquinone-dependent protoporphyrinogen oxidase